jgi:hypothetical protein
VERGARGIDLGLEAPIPEDDDATVIVDLVHDASVTGPKPGFVASVRRELDAHPYRDARTNAGREQLCTVSVHGWLIGFEAHDLDPLTGTFSAGEHFVSTKMATPAGCIRIRRLRIALPAS